MSEGKDALKSFCQARMRHPPDVAMVLEHLDAFFRRGDCGRYTLSPEGTVSEDTVLRATQTVTGWHLVSNRYFTRRQCYPAEHLPDSASCFGVTDIEKTLGEVTKSPFWNRYVTPLENEIGSAAYHEMSEVFVRALGEPLWHSFECPVWQDFGYDLKLGVRALILMVLLAFVGHVIYGHVREVQEIAPLLAVLQHCIPYGYDARDNTRLLTIVE